MTWNFRIFRHKDKHVWYGLHEVFYNDQGVPETYATEPDAVGDTIDELIDSLVLMIRDAGACQKAKKILTKKDFEKGGRYYASFQAWEKEVEDAVQSSVRPRKKRNARGISGQKKKVVLK
jgi:hypothetical protein